MNTAVKLQSWEGQVVDGKFPLLQWVSGSPHGDVFLTELPGRESHKAAIKLIPAGAGNAATALSRWQAIAELSHPHLIRLFEMGQCQINAAPLLYVVMEFAEEDLSQVLPSRSLTPAEAEEMLRAVIDVLSFVHGKGFVHGRIKPSNVMAVGDQLKISSDCLQLSGRASDRVIEPSVYDAPEAINGALSPASDVWSLGMTLVAALSQHPPAWDRSGQKRPVVADSIPEPFREIARECLRLDPHQRCTLEQIRSPLHHSAAPAKTSLMPIKPRTWLLIAAQIFLIALLAGLWLVTHRGSVQPRQETAKTEKPVSSTQPLLSPPAANVSTGVIQGAVTERVLPNVPRSASNTIQGKVKVMVRVVVDSTGNVSTATLESPGPSKYFAGLALAAARRWKFKPAQVDGKPVSSKWTLRFRFGRATTEVAPVETSP
jgi:TonB family protein